METSKVGTSRWLARGAFGALLVVVVGCRSSIAEDPEPKPDPGQPFTLSITITGDGGQLKVQQVLAEYVTTNAACAQTSYLKGGSVSSGRHLRPVAVLERERKWLGTGYYDAITPGRCAWAFAGVAVAISDAGGRRVAVAPLSSDKVRGGPAFLECIPRRGETPGSCYLSDPEKSPSGDRFFVRIDG